VEIQDHLPCLQIYVPVFSAKFTHYFSWS